MKFGKETRKFTADVLVKVAEYLVSIVILGSIISGKFKLLYLMGSAIIFAILIFNYCSNTSHSFNGGVTMDPLIATFIFIAVFAIILTGFLLYMAKRQEKKG